MSWNNNGNNGSRDPWGGKDGPPDIDEALKKFREQFSFLFGKRSSSGGGDFKPRKILTSALAVISILYAALGIYTVVLRNKLLSLDLVSTLILRDQVYTGILPLLIQEQL